ncbi:MAG: virulence RhuM family protein [Deltaproteobacteria bacterium]|nr:virulence RhuM family protein [Deltaproteobacteria bacterium]
MADLFQVTVPTINEHIKNIFNERELSPDATIRKFRIVQKEGQRNVTRMVDFYNLDMIISVGYRVKSHVATRFRETEKGKDKQSSCRVITYSSHL